MVQCRKIGCEADATHLPRLLFWAETDVVRTEQTACRLMLNIELCEIHAREATIADLVSDDGWQEIVNAVTAKGLAVPDRSSLKVGIHRMYQA